MDKMDYKKQYKDLYSPKTTPMIIDVPSMSFILVDGKGNPNQVDGEYSHAVELLYALSYAIKMSKMGTNTPNGYFKYVVPPLEGFWWLSNKNEFDFQQKEKFCWTSMIRQPEFVTNEVFQWACDEVKRKKPHLKIEKARFETIEEGLCVQCMHIGSFDNEPITISKINQFIDENNLLNDISEKRRHHEIYLGDPRKCDMNRMKTVLRHPVRK